MTARKDGKPNRPNVTEAELKAFYAACDIIREEEPQMSVRGYAYRIGGMATYDEDGNITGGIKLHGDYCTKEPPAPGEDPINSESIKRYILYGRRTGRLSYDSVIDDTRPTSYASSGWRHRASAISYADNARKSMIRNYSLAIVTGIGVVAVFMGARAVGVALVCAGVGSMLAAALVLLVSSPDKARAAATQGTFPLIAIVLLVIGLAM